MNARSVALPLAFVALALAACRADSTAPTAPAAPAPSARDAELLAKAKDAALIKQGKDTYAGLCLACHGPEKNDVDSPSNLFDPKWYHGATPTQIEATILKGVLEKGMPGWGEILPAEDTTAVTAYLLSFQKPDASLAGTSTTARP